MPRSGSHLKHKINDRDSDNGGEGSEGPPSPIFKSSLLRSKNKDSEKNLRAKRVCGPIKNSSSPCCVRLFTPNKSAISPRNLKISSPLIDFFKNDSFTELDFSEIDSLGSQQSGCSLSNDKLEVKKSKNFYSNCNKNNKTKHDVYNSTPKRLSINQDIQSKENVDHCLNPNTISSSKEILLNVPKFISNLPTNVPNSDKVKNFIRTSSFSPNLSDSPDLFGTGDSNLNEIERPSNQSISQLCKPSSKYDHEIKNRIENTTKSHQSIEVVDNDNECEIIIDASFCSSFTSQVLNNSSHVGLLSPKFRSPNTSITSCDSTQDSQPLLGRFRNKLLSPVDGKVAALKTDEDRRADAIRAVLEEAKSNQFSNNFELGPFYGLPTKVSDLLQLHKGIKNLYKWQEDCIHAGMGTYNLLLSLPTSGGKTLVAEILILRQLLLARRDVIFILPYVALVQEKVRGLSPFGVELDFLIEEYAGNRGIFPPKKRTKKRVAYIATIEKASGLVNTLLEADRINEVGLVVVDEAHMIGENGGRGAVLEGTLAKLRYAARGVQLLGMSATIGNLEELAKFMDAILYTGSFRPVELKEYIKMENYIGEVNPKAYTEEELLINQKLCAFPYSQEQKRLDVDMVCGLITEVIPDHSCLVFCPTRVNCESIAKLVCRFLPRAITRHHRDKKYALYQAIIEEGGGTICPILKRTIPYGIAYHHSGLTDGERRLVEEGYIAGTLCCISCTSTLAAGVNLPARRVIIRAPYTGSSFMTRSRYQQMIGRAGRAGLDTKGESFLVIQNRDAKRVADLLLSPVEVCRSTLMDEDMKGLIALVFSALGLGIVHSLPDSMALVDFSLLALQAPLIKVDVHKMVTDMIEDLRTQGLLRIKTPTQVTPDEMSHDSIDNLSNKSSRSNKLTPGSDISINQQNKLKKSAEAVLNRPVEPTDHLGVSRLGRAAIKGNVELKLAQDLYNNLLKARESLVVNSHLHLLYLVVPYPAVHSCIFRPDVFYQAYTSLGPLEKKVGQLLGITEGVAIKVSTGQRSKRLDESVLKRFYLALMLHRLLEGECIWIVSESFQIHRGLVQQTLSSTAAFSSCVYNFCQELEELWAFRDLLATFSKHMSGVSSDILPLMEIPAIRMGRAKMLYSGGYKTIQDVVKANPEDLVNVVAHLNLKVASQIIDSAKMVLLEQAESLREQAEEVLLGICGH